MRAIDVISGAIRNSFRSRLRTSLTVVAIFIGAFTLTITNGLGTGINNYIDTQLSSIGAADVMTVTKPQEQTVETDGPTEYDPDAASAIAADGPPGTTVLAMTDTDLEALREIDGVVSAEAVVSVRPDYIQFDSGEKFEITVGEAGENPDLVAGSFEPGASEPQLVLPTDFVEPLGFSGNADAVGSTVTIAVTDGEGTQHELDATVAGVQEPTLFGSTALMNDELTSSLFDLQQTGVTGDTGFASATVRFDDTLDAAGIDDLKAALVDEGYAGVTTADQLGTFKAVIDGIILVLNAFAIIALIAAGFGIINTLLMSVQERTREIGLMKAMGMSGGRIFGLFSLEAVFIGLLGSAIGAGIAMGAGTVISSVLSNGLLEGLAGLQIIAFTPLSIATVLLLVMGIAFVAAVLPASRAARQSPIDSLRYE